jgi:hypothetical protein
MMTETQAQTPEVPATETAQVAAASETPNEATVAKLKADLAEKQARLEAQAKAAEELYGKTGYVAILLPKQVAGGGLSGTATVVRGKTRTELTKALAGHTNMSVVAIIRGKFVRFTEKKAISFEV